MRPWLQVLVVVLGVVLGAPLNANAGASRTERASRLLASANRRISQGTHEQRQFALGELLEAAKLDPARSEIQVTLGRLNLDADHLRDARQIVERLEVSDSTSADVWLFGGQVRRRVWLVDVDEAARDRAIRCFSRSARLAPRSPQPLIALVPLLVDAGELEGAHDAAVLAVRLAPKDPDALLLMAEVAQQSGDLATAERLFDGALPRLPALRRERYDDIAALLPPLLAERVSSMEPNSRAKFVEKFWAATDPDPVSAENEAKLEYWSRVTQAIALFGTASGGRWDMRAQYYARFGQPQSQLLNPVDPDGQDTHDDRFVWAYPQLGMRVAAASPSSYVGFPASLTLYKGYARANPESLSKHPELLPVFGGFAVFRGLPASVEPVETRLALAQFQSDRGVNLFAQLEAAGGVGNEYTVEWVVLDSAYAPVARDKRTMVASACRADEARASSFTAALTSGRYRIGVVCSDESGRRGVIRRDFYVSPASPDLALSDLVITCGAPGQSVVAGSGVRLEPETGLFPAEGDRLNAYVEIYHLARLQGGESAFSYDCVVRSVVSDKRGWWSRLFTPLDAQPPIRMSRTETTHGTLRRQFLSVPVGALPSGPYRIELVVHDEANGQEVSSAASFERRR